MAASSPWAALISFSNSLRTLAKAARSSLLRIMSLYGFGVLIDQMDVLSPITDVIRSSLMVALNAKRALAALKSLADDRSRN